MCVHFNFNYVLTKLQRTKVETFHRSVYSIIQVQAPGKSSCKQCLKLMMFFWVWALCGLAGFYQPVHMALKPRRTSSVSSPPWKPQISYSVYKPIIQLTLYLCACLIPNHHTNPAASTDCFQIVKIPYLQNTVAVDKQVARFDISMKNAGRMEIFQTCTYNILFY
jgi:hypothetical protein